MSGDKLSRRYQIAAWHALQVCLHATCPEMGQDITWSSGMLNPVEDSSHRNQPVEFLTRPAMLTRGLRGESLVSSQQNAPLQWTFSSYQRWASMSPCWLGHRGCFEIGDETKRRCEDRADCGFSISCTGRDTNVSLLAISLCSIVPW